MFQIKVLLFNVSMSSSGSHWKENIYFFELAIHIITNLLYGYTVMDIAKFPRTSLCNQVKLFIDI